MNRLRSESGQAEGLAMAVGFVVVVVGVIALIGAAAWLFSFHGVDQGNVAIVREGGPFDGRGIKEVRQPGSGAKPIGAFNHQDVLPVTQRDLTEEAGNIVVPTADGVNVVVDGQALFQLRTDEDLVTKFYKNFGRRKWDGENIGSDQGWVNFLKIRMVPILYQSVRQVIGTRDCTSLNNTCVYVLNADSILASDKGTDNATKEAKKVNTEQNLSDAEARITEAFKENLKEGLGDEYFEGVRFQNLRVVFPADIQRRVQAAQGKRAEVAEAKLEADRKTEAAKGDTAVAQQEAEQIRLKSKAYRRNPAQGDIDRLKALCGPDGCQQLQVLGGGNVISNLGSGSK